LATNSQLNKRIQSPSYCSKRGWLASH